MKKLSFFLFCLAFMFLVGCKGATPLPQLVINNYGTTPYIRGTASMNNPRVLVLRAPDDGIQRRVIINDAKQVIELAPGEISKNQYLEFGWNKIVTKRWRDIPPSGREDLKDGFNEIHVSREGRRAHIITLRR